MVAAIPSDALIRLPAIADNFQCLITSLGRDGLLRLAQFCACFYAWVLSKSNLAPGDSTAWKLLSERTTHVRRMSRLGRNIEFFDRAIRGLVAKNECSFIRYTSFGHRLGLAVFLTWDALVALDTLAIYKLKSVKNSQRAAVRSWLAAILCNIIGQVYKLSKLQHQERSDEENGERNRVTM
ncbi:hypothetical protein CDV36_015063 [Fusarium kuroshium]|uniref:Uncharacterized protein n=1 Tax=Fusarium kuroshium TaxID=2010991 RepID=A0A3M2RE13_9HYPO|nr:hypothetical protein CDV36_015063 [Fusarium kuroshium]